MAYSQLLNIINVLHTALSKQFASELSTIPESITAHLKRVYGAHPCSCVSAGVRQDLLALIGDITKTITIYNPCDLTAIKKAAAQPLSLESYGLTNSQYLIHVGSFDVMKNHRDLLQAYAKTNRSYPLVPVGKGRLEDEIK